jgi:hypothetical protein
MNTKRDSLESIPFDGVGAEIGRLVLSWWVRVDICVPSKAFKQSKTSSVPDAPPSGTIDLMTQ